MAMNSFSAFKAVLRATRTVLRNFYPQIGMRCGPMVQGLLKGESGRCWAECQVQRAVAHYPCSLLIISKCMTDVSW